jgi:hypothetical protein
MPLNRLVFLLLGLLFAGCTTQSGLAPASTDFHGALAVTNALVTQRAVLRIRGREFALNGYLAINNTQDMRMVVTEMFGQVLADVLLDHDGRVQVIQSSRLLRQTWIERYLASDVRCIFGALSTGPCPVRKLGPNHFLIERPRYALDLRILETRPGPQPAELFDESKPGRI